MKIFLINKTYICLLLVAAMSLTSCLKDKGFEDGKYSTVGANTVGSQWVSIPLGSRWMNNVGVESKAGFQPVPLFPVAYDFENTTNEDITVTIAVNNSLIAQRDTLNTTTPLPASSFNVPSTTVVIPAGQRVSAPFAINMNTSTLDPMKKYSVGFSITAVSKTGVAIPENMKDAVFVFTIKNRFDGIYTVRSRMDHPSDRDPLWLRTPFTYGYFIELITTGPLTVEWNNQAFGDGFHPLQTPGVSGFGSTRVAFEFTEDNKLVRVWNAFPNPSNGRAFNILTGTDPKTGVTINNRFDPDTKTVYAAFQMTQPGFAPIPIFDTLNFEKVRP